MQQDDLLRIARSVDACLDKVYTAVGAFYGAELSEQQNVAAEILGVSSGPISLTKIGPDDTYATYAA